MTDKQRLAPADCPTENQRTTPRPPLDRSPEANLLGAVRYAGSVVLASFAGNAGRSHGLDLDEIFPLSLQMTGPQNVRIAVQEICREVRVVLGKRDAPSSPEAPPG